MMYSKGRKKWIIFESGIQSVSQVLDENLSRIADFRLARRRSVCRWVEPVALVARVIDCS
jgi:hypothetical protein